MSQAGLQKRRQHQFLRLLTHAGALAPLAAILWAIFSSTLTVNPIQDLTFRTGKAALVLLVLALACTPINIVFKYTPFLKVRRTLGLYTFFYVSLHLLIFLFDNALTFDYHFNWGYLQEAIFEKRFALVGFAAFLILLPLAITSTKGWKRRLGKSWTRMHKGIYLAAVLAVLHFIWLVKSDIREPLAWGALVGLLLALRHPQVKKIFRNTPGLFRRKRKTNPKSTLYTSPKSADQM